ncbi:MAG: hypothetical protein RL223_5074 [Pseudomonadota bacterium]
MKLSYDPAKNARNIAERSISFESARDFDWSTAAITEDLRKPYPERRFQALGLIGERLHMLVFTPRHGALHVISLRYANERERRRHARSQDPTRHP